MCGTCGCKSAESGKKNCGCGQDPCKTFGAESPTIKFEVGKFYYTGTDYYKDAVIKIVKRTPTRVYFTYIDLLDVD